VAGITKESILKQIRPVEDPDIGMSLVDMGLIYDVEIIDDKRVNIKMTLSSPGCPIGDYLLTKVREAALKHDGVEDADVFLVWEPPWDPAKMAADYVKDALGIW
jgi:metal-sulfur cluster biosynthetic enzyme